MEISIRKVPKALLIALIMLLVSAGRLTGQKANIDCLSAVENQLGKKIAAEMPLLEVNKDYAAEVEFAKDCKVLQIAVMPKYVWQHRVALWTEPDYLASLTGNQYDDLLSRISRLQVLGSLIKKGDETISVVTNSKTTHWDQYESAFVRRTIHCCPSEKPERIFSFKVYFLHRVNGRIRDVKLPQSPNDFQITRIKINNGWYLISAKEFEKVRIGNRTDLNVAGPIN